MSARNEGEAVFTAMTRKAEEANTMAVARGKNALFLAALFLSFDNPPHSVLFIPSPNLLHSPARQIPFPG